LLNVVWILKISKIENANYVSEVLAEVTLSTIHKSKGREWDNVRIEDDFLIFNNESTIDDILKQDTEELNLIYVAVTRAKGSLYINNGVGAFITRLKAFPEPKILSVDPQKLPDNVYIFPSGGVVAH
jgi:superfamily I DNA/RNA helicase